MPLRVLIVDDHTIIALAVGGILQKLGHSVIATVTTGREAVDWAAQHRPDLVLMDIELKGDMDGVAAAIAIKNSLGISSVFFSGHLDEETRRRAAEAEPIAFLAKTASTETISEVLKGIESGAR